MKKPLAIFGLLGGALLVYLLLREEGPGVHEADAPTLAIESEEVDGPGPPESADLVREAVAAENLEPPVTKEGAVVPGRTGLLGTIVVLDENGVEHPGEDGEIGVYLFGGEDEEVTLEVKNGIFSLGPGKKPDSMYCLEVDLGGRLGHFLGDALERPIPISLGTPLELRAQWYPIQTLRVFGQDTGGDLASITVLYAEQEQWDVADYPAGDRTSSIMARGLESPIDLSKLRIPEDEENAVGGGWDIFVHSPGYAWKRLAISHRTGGERTVTLPRAGEVEIVLHSGVTEATDGLMVRLYADEGEDRIPYAAVPAGPETLLDSVTPGLYRVSAEFGLWYQDKVVTASEEVLVQSGVRSIVHLHPASPDEPRAFPVAGTVVVPTEWKVDDFSLRFELSGTPALGQNRQRVSIAPDDMVAMGPGAWRFDAGDLQEGMYLIQVLALPGELDGLYRSLTHAFMQEVASPGLSDLQVVVPSPGRIRVNVVDASGVPVDVSSIMVGDDRSTWISPSVAPSGGEVGVFEFMIAQGPLTIDIWEQGYEPVNREVEVVAGMNEVNIRLAKACGVALKLFEETTRIPWPDGWHPELQLVGGEEGIDPVRVMAFIHEEDSPGVIELTLSEPGLYDLRIKGLSGYEVISGSRFQVQPGAISSVDVRLRRQR